MKIMDAALGRLKFNDVVAVTKLTYGEFYQKAIERFEQGYYFEAQREPYDRWITGKSIERDRIRMDNLTNLAFLTDSTIPKTIKIFIGERIEPASKVRMAQASFGNEAREIWENQNKRHGWNKWQTKEK